jgi:hypothetical protein
LHPETLIAFFKKELTCTEHAIFEIKTAIMGTVLVIWIVTLFRFFGTNIFSSNWFGVIGQVVCDRELSEHDSQSQLLCSEDITEPLTVLRVTHI